MIGSKGAIVGTANVVPRLCVEHFNDIAAFQENPTTELLSKIQADQDLLSRADRALSKCGVMATKYALQRFYYPQGPPRRPLQRTDNDVGECLEEALKPALLREEQLESEHGVLYDTVQL